MLEILVIFNALSCSGMCLHREIAWYVFPWRNCHTLSPLMLLKACGSVLLWYVFPWRKSCHVLSTLIFLRLVILSRSGTCFLEDAVTGTMH